MTPEEIKFSQLAANLTLESIGLSREKVLAMTAGIPRVATPKTPTPPAQVSQKVGTPRKFCPLKQEAKIAAAKKAVELFKAGASAGHALKTVGLSTGYTKALKECAAGGGPLMDKALNKTRAEKTTNKDNDATFIRWYYEKPLACAKRTTEKQTQELIARAKRSGISGCEISKRAGLCRTAISNVVSGTPKTFSLAHYDALCRVLDGAGK